MDSHSNMDNKIKSGVKTETLLKTEIVLIDNFDSFTYNLVNQLKPMARQLKVYRNSIALPQLIKDEFSNNGDKIIVISPGPGSPDGAGITLPLLEKYRGVIPILGICLGHQAIIQSYAGEIGAARNIVHGKACNIQLEQSEKDLFAGLSNPFRAARYHSLAATQVPAALKVVATADNEVMAVKHRQHKVLGFQFHPESILTPEGGQLMRQALTWLSEKPAV